MAYSPLTPSIYVGTADSYFTDTRPDALMGRLQSVTLTEGVDANRPFQRFRNSRLDFEIIISAADAGERPYQAGQLVWLEVAAGAGAAEVWFKGPLRDPDYDVRRSGRSSVRMTAIDVSDVFKETISVASQSANTIAENIALLLDGVGWPDDADWRDIDADLIEQLSAWQHDDRRAISGLQELADTTGPPARMVIKRNGGLQVIKDVSDTVAYSFTDRDVRSRPVVRQYEDSVINMVTIEGTTLGSLNSVVRSSRPLEYRILDGLASAERVNVIRRILAAYENGLTSLTMEMVADDDRNQADVLALRPGTVIEQDSGTLGQTYMGPISSLRWEWRRTRATMRVNMEVQPPQPTPRTLTVYMTGYDNNSSVTAGNRLYFVNLTTGIATLVDVGDIDQFVRGLGYDSDNNYLYGLRQGDADDHHQGENRALTSSLGRINVSTGVGTLIGEIIGPVASNISANSLAYDSINSRMLCTIFYAELSSSQAGYFGTIDLSTAAFTAIGPASLGYDRFEGNALAFDPSIGVAYCACVTNFFDHRLIAISPTGAVTEISNDAFWEHVTGLAWNPNTNELLAVDDPTINDDGGLWRVNVQTGIPTRIGTTDAFGIHDLKGPVGLTVMVNLNQLSAPTGLALTEAGGDITADWNDVADATGYVLEWREEGSSGAWQTADVASPPHTFTP